MIGLLSIEVYRPSRHLPPAQQKRLIRFEYVCPDNDLRRYEEDVTGPDPSTVEIDALIDVVQDRARRWLEKRRS